jgi:mannose-6-phosphate isomerase
MIHNTVFEVRMTLLDTGSHNDRTGTKKEHRMRYAVIDARARGDGLRPLTNSEMPTAFLALGDRRTLLQRAVDRLGDVILSENVWVLVEPSFLARAKADLDDRIHIVTSDGGEIAALGKVLSEMSSSESGGAAILVESVTHVIKNVIQFRQCLIEGFETAESTGQVVAFTAKYEGQGLYAAGIQCWPFAKLALWLESHESRTTDVISHLLASTEEELQSFSLTGVGWAAVDDWESVKHVLAYVEKPWGHERLWALNENYAGKMLFIKAGESLSLQYHEIKDETIRIASGRMRFRSGPSVDRLETHILDPGMSYEIAPRVVHQMEAIEDCTVIEVSTPHLTDVVRLEDRYGRS